MAEASLEGRFRGTCNLVILHLRRAAKSNDLEVGFAAARELGMLSRDREDFIRSCLSDCERVMAGEAPEEPVDDERIRKLQACVLSLNTADPA